jgi:Mg-chelatase subunit ChlD
MPHLSFITPAALVLLILLPLLAAFTLLTPRRVAPGRFWASLLIRSVVLVALVLGLAGAQLVRPVRALTTVFLIDASDSVAPAQRERADQYVADALHTMPAGDLAAVVVFGANALVERVPTGLTQIGRINSVPIATRTNIQDAVQLGIALLPADTQKRLVLLSDGGENIGQAAEAARLAAVRGVPLDVVPLLGAHGLDVIVGGLDAPATVRAGQELALGVFVRADFATTGRLQVFVDGQLAQEQDVTIAAGANTIPLRVPAGEAGFRRLEVRLDAQGDTEPQNNRAAAFTEVQGPPRILLIASDAARAANLRAALDAGGLQADLRTPAQVPTDLAQLSAYAGVVLVDTPARDLPRPLMDVLPVYVRELGRGLAMVGGGEAFGAGGYRRTPIVQALPVDLDPRANDQLPDIALVMVIDRSGSMADTSDGGRSKLDLAKEAVYQATQGLSARDQIGLVVFDDTAQWVLPIQRLPPAVDIQQALDQVGPGGGTNIRSGIALAAPALASVKAKIKHVILLTDGIAQQNYADLIDQLRAAGTTISTVAIGDDADVGLQAIARRGGGRYYRVSRAADVPSIFLQETVIAAGRDIVEGRFTPSVALLTPAVRGLGALPPLYGYNGTTIKETARTILSTPDGAPLLAQWQYGLGRVVAWTSDLKGQWARDWVGWSEFPHFVGSFVDLLLPARDTGTLALRGSTAGDQAALELTAQDEQGRPLNDIALEGRLIDPANQGTPLQFSQIGAGRYRAVTSADTPGVYLAQVAASVGGQALGLATTGLVVSYSPEYGDERANPQLLRDLAANTGGRVEPAPSAVFAAPAQAVGSVQEIGLPLLWLALLLWPIDIGVRRLYLASPVPWLAALGHRLIPGRRAQPERSEALARLSAAKQRAQAPRRAPGAPALRPSDEPRPARSAEQLQPEDAPASAVRSDDQLARLLAAKQRARRRRNE